MSSEGAKGAHTPPQRGAFSNYVLDAGAEWQAKRVVISRWIDDVLPKGAENRSPQYTAWIEVLSAICVQAGLPVPDRNDTGAINTKQTIYRLLGSGVEWATIRGAMLLVHDDSGGDT